MDIKDNFMLMAEYNKWMNGKIYKTCSAISDNDRKKDMGAFFRSIHGTLNHLLYGDKAWMGRFKGKPFEVKVIGEDIYSEFEELHLERVKTDKEIVTWSTGLDNDWLKNPFNYTSNVDGKTRVLPAWIFVTHMFNHQTHHRGQVTTLLKQLGIDPGITDIPWMPEFDA